MELQFDLFDDDRNRILESSSDPRKKKPTWEHLKLLKKVLDI